MPKKSSKKVRTTNSALKNKKVWPLYAVAIIFIGLIGTLFLTSSNAASFQMYIAPSLTTVQPNDTFNVAVRIDPGTAVDGVTATLTYDQSILEFVSMDSSTSEFPVQIQANAANGIIKMDRGIFFPGYITTNALIANITFKAIASTVTATSPSTPLQLTGNASYQGQYINPEALGANVVVNNPVQPPDPGDTTAPTVTISSPLNGQTVTGKVAIKASAEDNVGIVRTEIYIDNSIRTSTTASSVSTNWNVKSKRIASGQHTITVKAYDANGNVGQTSVTVTKP